MNRRTLPVVIWVILFLSTIAALLTAVSIPADASDTPTSSTSYVVVITPSQQAGAPSNASPR